MSIARFLLGAVLSTFIAIAIGAGLTVLTAGPLDTTFALYRFFPFALIGALAGSAVTVWLAPGRHVLWGCSTSFVFPIVGVFFLLAAGCGLNQGCSELFFGGAVAASAVVSIVAYVAFAAVMDRRTR